MFTGKPCVGTAPGEEEGQGVVLHPLELLVVYTEVCRAHFLLRSLCVVLCVYLLVVSSWVYVQLEDVILVWTDDQQERVTTVSLNLSLLFFAFSSCLLFSSS